MTELPTGFSDEERNWSYAAHLGPLVLLAVSGGSGSFLVPLVVWLAKKDDSPTVVQHAKASLNFQLTLLIAALAIGLITIATLGLAVFIAVPALILLAVLQVVPLGRVGTESEVSAAIVFLLSPAAAFISGTTLRVDGAAPNYKRVMDLPSADPSPSFDGFHLAELPKVMRED